MTHDLPFQIHNGDARLQGSNPMLLLDLIAAKPKTKFILFHGGYPWVGETGAILMRHSAHVWLDSVWLPTIGQAGLLGVARREAVQPAPVGGGLLPRRGGLRATEMTRRCLAEVLAERVDRGDLTEEHARRIGKQVLRDNALALSPQLKDRLWEGKRKLTPDARR